MVGTLAVWQPAGDMELSHCQTLASLQHVLAQYRTFCIIQTEATCYPLKASFADGGFRKLANLVTFQFASLFSYGGLW